MNNTIDHDSIHIISYGLNEDKLYDQLLEIAKTYNIIEANHATNSSHLLHILRNNSIDINFE